MSASDHIELDSPHLVLGRLQEIERALAERQNGYESAARQWHQAQRQIRLAHARALLGSTKSSVTEKRAEAEIAGATTEGAELEAEYEATKAVIKMLDSRAMILMSVLKSQGRA